MPRVRTLMMLLLLLLLVWQRTNSQTQQPETAEDELLIVGEPGYVESPVFPRSYPRDITLRWTLRPLRGVLALTFDQLFGLEEPENGICKYDYVQVEEWVAGEQKLLGRWCGRSGGGRLESRAAQVVVLFHSDSYFPSSPGFRLHYAIIEVLETTTAFKDLPMSQVSLADSSPITLEELEGALSEVHSLEDLLFFLQPWNSHQQLLASYEQPADGQESQGAPRRGRAGTLLLSNTGHSSLAEIVKISWPSLESEESGHSKEPQKVPLAHHEACRCSCEPRDLG